MPIGATPTVPDRDFRSNTSSGNFAHLLNLRGIAAASICLGFRHPGCRWKWLCAEAVTTIYRRMLRISLLSCDNRDASCESARMSRLRRPSRKKRGAVALWADKPIEGRGCRRSRQRTLCAPLAMLRGQRLKNRAAVSRGGSDSLRPNRVVQALSFQNRPASEA